MAKIGFDEPARIISQIVFEHCQAEGIPDYCQWLADNILHYHKKTVVQRFQRNNWMWSEILDIQKFFSSRRLNDELCRQLEGCLGKK